MSYKKCPLCMVCKHLYKDKVAYNISGDKIYCCEAFPKGVPDSIFWKGHTHVVKGDNNIQFELDKSQGMLGEAIASSYFSSNYSLDDEVDEIPF